MTALDVFFSVDVEPDCPPYLATERGVTEGLPRLLELLAHEGVRTTCFSTGDVARRHPGAVRDLLAAGHELGAHGDTHARLDRLPADAVAAEIRRCTVTLREFASVTSFRAPNLQLPDAALDMLVAEGYRVDSSCARYKPWQGPPRRRAGLRRLAVSQTSSVLRLPRLVREAIWRRLASPVVLFVHPWEFVDLTHERLRLDCRFRTGDPALRCLRETLRFFSARGARFRRMDELQPLPVAAGPTASAGEKAAPPARA